MKNVLILGASGHIAHFTIQKLVTNKEFHLTLFSRHPADLKKFQSDNVTLFQGDVLNEADLDQVMDNVDVVYANLSGKKIEQEAKNVVSTMDNHGVKTLVWISSIGIYDEVPGKFGDWNNHMLRQGGANSYLGTYRAAADVIEASDLDYTIIRPAWLTNKDEVDYETTEKGQEFKGTEVSRKSIGTFVAKIITNPAPYAHRSIGVDKPGTEGDKPSWY